MHRYTFCDAYTNRCDFSVAVSVTNPYPRSLAIAFRRNAKLLADGNQGSFNLANESDNIISIDEFYYGVTNDLTYAMPSNLAAAIDVDDWSSIDGAFVYLSAATGGIDRRVLKEN